LEQRELPKPPAGLRKSGLALWSAISGALDLDERDQALLVEAARAKDRLDALDRLLRRTGLALPDGRPNPLLAEARQQQVGLARLIVALQLPRDLSQPALGKPQRRGVRGAYRPRHLSVVGE